MAFGDIIQSAHYYRTNARGTLASGASFTMGFSNPTQHGNAILILFNRGFSAFGSTAARWSISHANWSFTNRTVNDAGTAWGTDGQLFDCLGAMIGFGPITITNIAAGVMGANFHVSMYEIDTPEGCQWQAGLHTTTGEGWTYLAQHKALGWEPDRPAFIIHSQGFATNSGSFDHLTNPVSYSPGLGIPTIYQPNPMDDASETVPGLIELRVNHGVYNQAFPQPFDAAFWIAGAGASMEAGGVGGQYVAGTDAVPASVTSAASHFGGAGSYTARTDFSRDGTWTTTSTSRAFTKPTGTANGDAVFIFLVFNKPDTMAGWALGEPANGTWYTLPSGFSVLDEGSFGGYYGSAEDGWPPTFFPSDALNGDGDYPEDAHWVLAVKAAGSSEPSSYTTTFTAGYGGWGGAFTVASMPAAAQVLSAETAGIARGPDGNTGGVGPYTGVTSLGWGMHAGGRADSTKYYRRWAPQRANSTDYIVIHWSKAAHGVSTTYNQYPNEDEIMFNTQHYQGHALRVYNAGSDPHARLLVREASEQLSDTSDDQNNTMAKMWAVGIEYTPPVDGIDVEPRVFRMKELPYDLRNIRLGGE